eukprot:6313862-Pyramimonas_sp.AAC.1
MKAGLACGMLVARRARAVSSERYSTTDGAIFAAPAYARRASRHPVFAVTRRRRSESTAAPRSTKP